MSALYEEGIMQNLSSAAVGQTYSIKWMFGFPEIMAYLKDHQIEEGNSLRVLQNYCGNVIACINGKSFAFSKEVADRIKV